MGVSFIELIDSVSDFQLQFFEPSFPTLGLVFHIIIIKEGISDSKCFQFDFLRLSIRRKVFNKICDFKTVLL